MPCHYLLDELYSRVTVCSNCFSVNRYAEEPPDEIRERQPAAVTRYRGLPDRTERDSPPGTLVNETRERPICDCGVCSPFARDRPIRKRRAIEFAKNLSDTARVLQDEAREVVAEGGRPWCHPALFDHNRDALLYSVGSMKEKPELAFSDTDDRLFARSWDISRRWAGRRFKPPSCQGETHTTPALST